MSQNLKVPSVLTRAGVERERCSAGFGEMSQKNSSLVLDLRNPGLSQYPLFFREAVMPRGDKSAYTDKQKRQAEHIEEGYEERGVSEKEAERRAWATVNKQSGGGKKSGSGRKKKV
jgi:hypothetical protein